MKWKLMFLLAVLISVLSISTASAEQDYYSYDDVLLVINENSEISEQVGEYFAEQRGIEHIVYLDCPDDETVSWSTFNETIRIPIEEYLIDNDLVDEINYIVTTKGVPLGIYEKKMGCSIDSKLTMMLGNMSGTIRYYYKGYGNHPYHYYNKDGERFSREKYDMYLVTRLTGYDYDDIKQLIDNSAPENIATEGTFVLDVDPLFDDEGVSYKRANDRMRTAAEILEDKGYTAVLDETETYLKEQKDVLGYISWGSNDHAVNGKTAPPENEWLPGAIAETLVSTSARSFEYPPSYGQSLIADWINESVTGINGYVSEPFVDGTIHPDILFDRYTDGYNLADSFYMAMPNLAKNVVVGDPKMSLANTYDTVDSCGVITKSSVLSQNIEVDEPLPNNACLIIRGDDITLDCKGYTINGNSEGDGIAVNGERATIKNCYITDFGNGIDIRKNSGHELINLNLSSNNGNGIYMKDSDNNVIEAVVASFNSKNGITVYQSSGNIFTDITANSNSNGFVISNGGNNDFTDITAESNNKKGIYILRSSENTFENIVTESSKYGLYIRESDDNVFEDVVSYENQIGVGLRSSDNNELKYIDSSSNTGDGIVLSDAEYNQLDNIEASSNDGEGVYLRSGAVYNEITNLESVYNGRYGIKISSDDNSFNEVSAYLNQLDGIYISGDDNTLADIAADLNARNGISIRSNDNTLTNVSASSNDNDGIVMFRGSQSNTIINPAISGDSTYYIFDKSGSGVSNTLIFDNIYGQVNWTKESLSVTRNGKQLWPLELGSKTINITSDNIYVDVFYLPRLNSPAQLTYYGSYDDPVIYRNGELCPSDICGEITVEDDRAYLTVQKFVDYTPTKYTIVD